MLTPNKIFRIINPNRKYRKVRNLEEKAKRLLVNNLEIDVLKNNYYYLNKEKLYWNLGVNDYFDFNQRIYKIY